MPGALLRLPDSRRAIPGRASAGRILAALVAALLLLAGCTRLLLSQLDWLAVVYANGYVELTDRQESIVRDSIRRNLGVFRTRDVPEFVRVINALRADVGGTVTPDDAERRLIELEALGQRTATLLVADAVLLLRTFNAAQVDELFASFADRNADLAEEFSGESLAERRERQTRQLIKFTKRLTGALRPEQVELIREHVLRFHDLAPQWIDRRAAWQGALRVSLDGPREGGDFERRIAGLILDPNQFDSAAYRARVADNRRVIAELIAALCATLSPGQRAEVDQGLVKYQQDLLALAT
jgi:hypothetical protein